MCDVEENRFLVDTWRSICLQNAVAKKKDPFIQFCKLTGSNFNPTMGVEKAEYLEDSSSSEEDYEEEDVI